MASGVRYTFDPAKAASNKALLHSIAFGDATRFEWETALVAEGTRRDYGEPRYIALGLIGTRVHVMVFTPRGESVRLISLRKANSREIARYEKG